MKIPKCSIVLLTAATLSGGKVLRSGDFDDIYERNLAKIKSRTDSKLTSESVPEISSINDLLANMTWPAKHLWAKTLDDVMSGASASPCTAPVLARARLSPYGFGAHLNHFVNEVALAMYAGQPIALCTPPDVRDIWALYFEDPGFFRCPTCDWGIGPRDFPQMSWDISDDAHQCQAEEMKRFLYQKLLTPNREAQSLVEEHLSDLGLAQTKYIGVHIRRGDKIQEVPLVPMDKYVSAVVEMGVKMDINTVFLASDDPAAHAELQRKLGSSYTIVEQVRLPNEAYQLRGPASRSMPPPYGEVDEEKSVLVDVAALLQSAAFIGTASSNIGRLVYFQRDPAVPSVSLDEGGAGTQGFLGQMNSGCAIK